MKRNRKLIVGVILTAAAGFFMLQNDPSPAINSVAQTPGITETVTSESSFVEPCAYVWAHHDAPELTLKVDAAARAINSAASAIAGLFGEDCVYADGHSTFGVMETDFYVHYPTDDLTNEEAFGDWMAKLLAIITEIPREEIQGRYGFVEFWFEKNDAEHLIVRVPIQQYIDEAENKAGAELFRMFYTVQ
jgi:hypothetical protein